MCNCIRHSIPRCMFITCLIALPSLGGVVGYLICYLLDGDKGEVTWSPSAKAMAERIKTQENVEKIRAPFWKAIYLQLRDVREKEDRWVNAVGMRNMFAHIQALENKGLGQNLPELSYQEAMLIARETHKGSNTASFGLLAPYIDKSQGTPKKELANARSERAGEGGARRTQE